MSEQEQLREEILAKLKLINNIYDLVEEVEDIVEEVEAKNTNKR